MSNILIVFYSRGGNTEKAARELSKYINSDVEEIIDNKNRRGIFGYIFGGRDAMSKRLTSIQSGKYDPAKYEIIVLCTPTWASTMTPAVRTYIENHKDEFNKVACLVTQGGDCNGKIYEDFEEVIGKKLFEKIDIGGKNFKNDNWSKKIENFAQEITK